MEAAQHSTQEPSAFRMIATLGLAGFLAGVVLVGVYQLTKPLIDQNRAETLEQAIFKVLDGSKTYTTLQADGKGLSPVVGETGRPTIYAGKDSAGQLIGFAIPSEAAGYQDIISVLFGYDPVAKKVVGMEILESKETPGLGDKIYKDEDFVQQFADLATSPNIEAVKPGEKNAPNQVATITGATISSSTVVNIINKGLEKWRSHIENYLSTNAAGAEKKTS